MKKITLFYIEKNKKILKFLLSGSSATAVDIFLLFYLTEIVGMWYLYSAVFSFGVSFFVSFYMQKYWTFEDKREHVKTKQLVMYFLVAGTNLSLNTAILYYLVDYLGIYYLLAQLMAVGFLGIGSFLMYNIVIFKQSLKDGK